MKLMGKEFKEISGKDKPIECDLYFNKDTKNIELWDRGNLIVSESPFDRGIMQWVEDVKSDYCDYMTYRLNEEE